ncbi:MAG: hypothetical protein ACXACR_14240, partial [Candidatus Hodarchaeales archaeon]
MRKPDGSKFMFGLVSVIFFVSYLTVHISNNSQVIGSIGSQDFELEILGHFGKMKFVYGVGGNEPDNYPIDSMAYSNLGFRLSYYGVDSVQITQLTLGQELGAEFGESWYTWNYTTLTVTPPTASLIEGDSTDFFVEGEFPNCCFSRFWLEIVFSNSKKVKIYANSGGIGNSLEDSLEIISTSLSTSTLIVPTPSLVSITILTCISLILVRKLKS